MRGFLCLLICVAVLFTSVSVSSAQNADPIARKLDIAKKQFGKTTTLLGKKLLSKYKIAIAAYTKVGRSNKAAKLVEEMKRLTSSEKIAEVLSNQIANINKQSSDRIETRLNNAKKNCANAVTRLGKVLLKRYDAAIAAYTKAERTDDALNLMDERDFFAKSIKLPLAKETETNHAGKQIKPILKTTWAQRKQYAKFSPDNHRVGCWSTALGQILFYHRLMPSGKVSYECSTGYSISEDLESIKFNWRLFATKLTAKTRSIAVNQVARYLFFVAAVIQKDFDTGTYVLNNKQRAEALAKHFECETEVYSSKSKSIEELRKIIIAELDASRPVMIHIRDKAKKSFHAAVVDGYRNSGEKLKIHINMGHGGGDNGWFNFTGPVGKYNDPSYLKIITVKPIANKSKLARN